LTISLRRASMICLQMKRSTLSTLLRVVSNMERNIVNNMTTQLSFGMEGELGKPWPKIGVIL
jgi:quinolinate synthase